MNGRSEASHSHWAPPCSQTLLRKFAYPGGSFEYADYKLENPVSHFYRGAGQLSSKIKM
jgi:hypothetical protein